MHSSGGRGVVYRPYGRANSTGSSENLPPRTLARVSREIRDLVKNPPEGVRLVIDSDSGGSLGEIVAEVEGPVGTPYENKCFQLKLVITSEFPTVPPQGHFLTKIYHPNVDPTSGAICVNTLKKDWTAETTFRHILSVIRCLLIVPFPESSLNDEAGKLFMESYTEYAKRARLMASIHGRPSFEQPQEEENEGRLRDSMNRHDSVGKRSTLKTVNRAGGKDVKKAEKKSSKKKSLKRL